MHIRVVEVKDPYLSGPMGMEVMEITVVLTAMLQAYTPYQLEQFQ